ncbi:hypothetical protein MTO96_002901 [Rhipicephalus appendiculatus]
MQLAPASRNQAPVDSPSSPAFRRHARHDAAPRVQDAGRQALRRVQLQGRVTGTSRKTSSRQSCNDDGLRPADRCSAGRP